MKVIKITPGEKNINWEDFKAHGVIGTWSNSSSSIEEFKNLEIGTYVLAGNTTNTFVGFGVITGEYIHLSESERLNGISNYPHVRSVNWLYVNSVTFAQDILPYSVFLQSVSDSLVPLVVETYQSLGVDFAEFQSKDDTEIIDTNASSLINLLHFTKNIILYGPPGTGKTYSTKSLERLFLKSRPLSRISQTNTDGITELTLIESIALSLSILHEPINIKRLMEIQPLANHCKSNDISATTVQMELEKHIHQEDNTPIIGNTSYISFKKLNNGWQLSDDGRKYVNEHLRNQARSDWSHTLSARSVFVTFHPSFSYEEFVEGLRPYTENGQLFYEVRNGIFKQICRAAEQEMLEAASEQRDPRPFLIIIDEINRANIAKVFGELMTIIEDDKRLSKNENTGMKITLPYSREEFGVPENLYIIGTMNTADRSIALLDLALRRRFTFKEILPDYSIVQQTSGDNGIIEEVDIAALLKYLNSKLRKMVDRDHQIGHSYLTGVNGGLSELQFRWYRKIIPLLQEYFYNEGSRLQDVLGKKFIETSSHNSRDQGDYDVIELTGADFKDALISLIQTTT